MKIAIVKLGGLSAGGTERWLQEMALALAGAGHSVSFYYSDAVPYVASTYVHPGVDIYRRARLVESPVRLVEFHVEAKDITTATHPWIGSDFHELFNEDDYDVVLTAKAGAPEYPFTTFQSTPVVEYVTLGTGVDRTPCIAWSIHLSQWQRSRWILLGGPASKSSVLPIPVAPFPKSQGSDLRKELGIHADAFIMGFHQRPDDSIASMVPLRAFRQLAKQDGNVHFVLLGGGQKHRRYPLGPAQQRAHFLPSTGDPSAIARFLRTLDLYAHGRRDGETFGLVLAEAMTMGLPCVSHKSRFGANAQPETMGPGGFFAQRSSEYVRIVQRLAYDQACRRSVGRLAARYAGRYSIAPIASELENILSSAALGREPTSCDLAQVAHSPHGFLVAGPSIEATAIGATAIRRRPAPLSTIASARAEGREVSRNLTMAGSVSWRVAPYVQATGRRVRIVELEEGTDEGNVLATFKVNRWDPPKVTTTRDRLTLRPRLRDWAQSLPTYARIWVRCLVERILAQSIPVRAAILRARARGMRTARSRLAMDHRE